MRTIVFFDLPVTTKKERKVATGFRKALLDDGFEMLQFSVYTRLCPDRDNANKHLERVRRAAPENGSIRMLMLTEHQYTDMRIVAGKKSLQEEKNAPKQLMLF